jgi:hypothetical protein
MARRKAASATAHLIFGEADDQVHLQFGEVVSARQGEGASFFFGGEVLLVVEVGPLAVIVMGLGALGRSLGGNCEQFTGTAVFGVLLKEQFA